MDYSDLNLEEKIILMLIRDNADIRNRSTISIDEIKEECEKVFKISKKKTYLKIQKLIENGFISILSSGKGKTKTTYLIKK